MPFAIEEYFTLPHLHPFAMVFPTKCSLSIATIYSFPHSVVLVPLMIQVQTGRSALEISEFVPIMMQYSLRVN
jgi:hypothetical protein